MAAPPLPAPLRLPRLKFMTCGSVDDGKSTLIGRLLIDSGAVYEDHLIEARKASAGGEADLSFLVDGLKAEREQGITIDVAYRYFATARRSFLIADAPGHEQYTRNQAAAASQSDIAIVLVSADEGIKEQTLRHMAIAAMFGVGHVILAINKMDRVGWNEAVFAPLAEALAGRAQALGLQVVGAAPVSALIGEGIVAGAPSMPWYQGPTVLALLETFTKPAPAQETSPVLPVQWTGRIAGGGRMVFGELAAGRLSAGQLLVSDRGAKARLSDLWVAGNAAAQADAGDPVAIALEPELDLGRGAVLYGADNAQSPAEQVTLRLIWLATTPLDPGMAVALHAGSAETLATLPRLTGVMNLDTLQVVPPAGGLSINQIGIVQANILKPITMAPFEDQRTLGAVILVDRTSLRTLAAGVVVKVGKRSADTPWRDLEVNAEARARLLAQRPQVVWLTGLSGAGKTTIAGLLDRRLHALGRHTAVLDGDNLRGGLNSDLGFSDGDRFENIRRVGHVAALMADAGLIAIVSLISPIRAARQHARETIGAGRFIEVFVDAPLEICQARDPKGFYKRADAGKISNFTGVSNPYEPPEAPDLHIRTDLLSAEEAVDRILARLQQG